MAFCQRERLGLVVALAQYGDDAAGAEECVQEALARAYEHKCGVLEVSGSVAVLMEGVFGMMFGNVRGRTIAALGAMIALVAASCGSDGAPHGNGGATVSERSGLQLFNFDSLDVLTVTSDAVVLGTLNYVGNGRQISENGRATTFTEGRLHIEEVLASKIDIGDDVVVEDVDPGPWMTKGREVLLFIRRMRDSDAFVVINHQGVFSVTEEGRIVAEPLRGSGNDRGSTDELSAAIAELTLPELRDAIEDAARAGERGEIEPQEPIVEPAE